MQCAVQNGHILVRRDDVDAVCLDLHAVPSLENRHRGDALKQFGQEAGMVWAEMLNDDKSDAAARGYLTKETFQRFQSTSRGADADDRQNGDTNRSHLGSCSRI